MWLQMDFFNLLKLTLIFHSCDKTHQPNSTPGVLRGKTFPPDSFFFFFFSFLSKIISCHGGLGFVAKIPTSPFSHNGSLQAPSPTTPPLCHLSCLRECFFQLSRARCPEQNEKLTVCLQGPLHTPTHTHTWSCSLQLTPVIRTLPAKGGGGLCSYLSEDATH